jgi:aspartyl-tRNA synthetase
MAYKDAMEKYGCDKPDTRFPFTLTDVSECMLFPTVVTNPLGFSKTSAGVFLPPNGEAKDFRVRGLNFKTQAGALNKKQHQLLQEEAVKAGGKVSNLHF